jgi:hypothetical protein
MSLLLLAVWAGGVPGAEETPTEETWEVVHVDGVKVGSVHTTTTRLDARRSRTTADLELTFRRHGSLLNLRMEQGTDEDPDGKVLATFMRQHHPGGRQLVVVGAVEGNTLNVKVDEGRLERKVRWPEEVVGLHGLEHLFETRKAKPGDRFSFLRYEPTLNTVVTVRVQVSGPEETDLSGMRRSLVRVDMTPDRIVTPTGTVLPARAVWWLDDNGVPVRRQMDLEGLGTLIMTRTTKETARSAPGTLTRLPDLGLKALITINRTIPRPYGTRAAVYRITLRDDPDPMSALVSDGHQEVRKGADGKLELHVHPVRPVDRRTEEKSTAGKPGEEFLASCRYIDSGNENIRSLAQRIVGEEKDPWSKALRIERWVKANVRPDNGTDILPASGVAASRRGDCRSCGLLTAALCRAEGIPSRTAVGLIYVLKGKPGFGFHMWTEVWIEGRWLGLDGTLGRGGVSATHLKVADHHWHNVESLTPLLPVNRVLGKLAIEVVRVEGE